MKVEEKIAKILERSANSSVNIKDISYATVVSVTPLSINDGGLILDGDDLLVNEDLLPHIEYYTEFTGDIGDETKTYKNVKVKTKYRLKKGDMVAIKEINNSKKLILFKVVKGDRY